MKRFGLIVTAFALALSLGLFTANAQEEVPGANQWGDSGNCDGSIVSADVAPLQNVIISGSGNYSGCTPQHPDIQEVSGDGSLTSTDISIIKGWVIGNWPSGSPAPGWPTSIELGDTVLTHDKQVDGDTCTLTARTFDDPALVNGSADIRAGWGIIFEVNKSLSTCATAQLIGLDPVPVPGGGKGQIISGSTVYGYTDTVAAGGWASVTLDLASCGNGDLVVVDARVPGDSEAGASGNRFPNTLYAADSISVNVLDAQSVTCTDIAVSPATASVAEGGTQQFSVTCTYSDSSTDDCTLAGGATWSSTGDVSVDGTGLATAGQIPCAAGGSGTVTATNSSCSVTPSDSATVTVTNDDSLASTDIVNQPASVSEGATITWSVLETWSDGCTVETALRAARRARLWPTRFLAARAVRARLTILRTTVPRSLPSTTTILLRART